MNRLAGRLMLTTVVVFVAIQFFGPAPSNPPVDEAITLQASVEVPPDVQGLLDRSCADCHTRRTEWPWYSRVSPVRWFVVSHVDDGRSHLDFDRWARYSDYDKQNLLEELCEEVEKGEMPLGSYLPLHSDAALSETDRELLCEWARQERQRVLARMNEGASGEGRDAN